MLRHPFLTAVVVVLSTLASGTLECSRPARSPAEAQGEHLYGRMCSVCHGSQGEGYRADQAPAIAGQEFLGSVTDGFLRAAIANGRVGTTMSAWSFAHGGPLATDDIESLIAFLRGFHRGPPRRLDSRAVNGDDKAGTEIFGRECATCHGERGTGGKYVSIGNPELLGTSTNAFLRDAITSGRPATPMAAFGTKLGVRGIDDVITHLRTLQAVAAPVQPDIPLPPPPIPLGPVPLNPKGPEPVGFKKAPDTTPADVIHAELERGAKMALLDARAPSDYRNDHIAGAVSVPFYDPAPYLADLPKNAWLVAYCACPHAESGQLAQRLLAAGFTKVTILDEGLGVWRSKKYGTHQGAEP